jgi:hypothetical protein
MNRNVLTTNYGEDMVRHTVRIEGEEASAAGMEGFRAKMLLIAMVVDQPDLLRHGGDCPESTRIYHDGKHWVIETITIASRKP